MKSAGELPEFLERELQVLADIASIASAAFDPRVGIPGRLSGAPRG